MFWSITPVDFGTNRLPACVASYLDCSRSGQANTVLIHSTGFLLRSSSSHRVVLVDSGFGNLPEVKEAVGEPLERTHDQDPVRALELCGISPAEVTDVIFTHLHFDHCGNTELYVNASFHVQERELEYARDPLPDEGLPYLHHGLGLRPSWDAINFHLLSGDQQLFDGIDLLHTPGHTPGSQMVLVETFLGGKKQTACLAGDNFFFYRNIEENKPCGHLYSRADWFRSIEKAQKRCDFFIPGHDPDNFRRFSIQRE